jgi:hypothetical protein
MRRSTHSTTFFAFVAVAMIALALCQPARAASYFDGDIEISTFLEFPQPDNPLTPIDESKFGNPAILATGPDTCLYNGLFGVIYSGPVSTLKGIGRKCPGSAYEVITQFPPLGGVVEKIRFGPDTALYAVTAQFGLNNPGIRDGMVRVNTTTGAYTQYWTATTAVFPAGLTFDTVGNAFVSDPVGCTVYIIDTDGNEQVFYAGPEICWDSPYLPFGVNGIVFNPRTGTLLMANFARGVLLEATMTNDGAFESIKTVIEDPALITFDNMNLSSDNKYLFFGVHGTGVIGRINLTKNPVRLNLLTQTSDGLGEAVDCLPAAGYGDETMARGLFVPDLSLRNGIGTGKIFHIAPVCSGPADENSAHCSLH